MFNIQFSFFQIVFRTLGNTVILSLGPQIDILALHDLNAVGIIHKTVCAAEGLKLLSHGGSSLAESFLLIMHRFVSALLVDYHVKRGLFLFHAYLAFHLALDHFEFALLLYHVGGDIQTIFSTLVGTGCPKKQTNIIKTRGYINNPLFRFLFAYFFFFKRKSRSRPSRP